jgi:hypothetical protein
MQTIEELIGICQKYAQSHQYCWFRISFCHIGDLETWVSWFEYLGTNPRIDHTKGAPTLRESLEGLIKVIG